MDYKFLIEASGSLTSSYLINSIKEANYKVVASDITECAGSFLADEFIISPKAGDPDLWSKLENLIFQHKINVIIPSLDETLLSWSERKDYFKARGVHVILSESTTIEFCQDKWETFCFFKKNNIPTPETSLEYSFPLVKPRFGRGGQGVILRPDKNKIKMDNLISQQHLDGEEYTIDVFCDSNNEPIYIIPRKRLQVKDGKSVIGEVVFNDAIQFWIKKICSLAKFSGPINIQCFISATGEIKFTEINPRIAGGMALGFAASENWIPLIVHNLIEGRAIKPSEVKYGMKMFRYYNEVYST